MLILTRKDNQSIFIGDEIEVKVLGVNENQVRIGISAPSDVTILREEIIGNQKNPQPKKVNS